MAIQVGGAGEGHHFGLEILQLKFGKKGVPYQISQRAEINIIKI